MKDEIKRRTRLLLAHIHVNLWLLWDMRNLFNNKMSCKMTTYGPDGKTKKIAAVTGTFWEHNIKITKSFYHDQP
jgi:hypothetical protein